MALAPLVYGVTVVMQVVQLQPVLEKFLAAVTACVPDLLSITACVLAVSRAQIVVIELVHSVSHGLIHRPHITLLMEEQSVRAWAFATALKESALAAWALLAELANTWRVL